MITPQQARALLGKHGVVESQERTDWMGEIPLPDEIARFYEEVGPSDITITIDGEHFFFPRLTSLWDVQAGYRYNLLTGASLPDWNDDWLVIVDRRGNPLLYSCATAKIVNREGALVYGGLYEMVEALA